jgi:hypothetical protein
MYRRSTPIGGKRNADSGGVPATTKREKVEKEPRKYALGKIPSRKHYKIRKPV